jgi:hypothetical protein
MEYFKLGRASAAPTGLGAPREHGSIAPAGGHVVSTMAGLGSGGLRSLIYGRTSARLDKYAGDAV